MKKRRWALTAVVVAAWLMAAKQLVSASGKEHRVGSETGNTGNGGDPAKTLPPGVAELLNLYKNDVMVPGTEWRFTGALIESSDMAVTYFHHVRVPVAIRVWISRHPPLMPWEIKRPFTTEFYDLVPSACFMPSRNGHVPSPEQVPPEPLLRALTERVRIHEGLVRQFE